ncbi:MAG: hypothetical protein ACKPCP_06030 [Sphaerospermopsis kisseleviana]
MKNINMTLDRLKFLAHTIEVHIKSCQDMLLTTDPEVYGDYYQNQISESRQHLYQLSRAIERFEKDIAYLEICLKQVRNQ